ncbi:FeoA family protein [uncultured Parolsenella sp.]|uniref:FeoA family protein n=1 Tax=uncultured Parolsenella sp. TaxID=2083008 RepID=UPI0025923322|nr:FeoA family protein [uncultured Parolsenella sp.]
MASDDVALRQHILDMGLTPGTEVTMMKYAPMGDPMEIRLRGYELTLRRADAHRRRRPHPLCPGGQPELRQDHAVQPAHGLEPARGQLPGRHGRPQGRHRPQPSRGHGD